MAEDGAFVSGLLEPVPPDSPGSPAIAEANLAAIMEQLSSLAEELKQSKTEAAYLRDALRRMQRGDDEDDSSVAAMLPQASSPAVEKPSGSPQPAPGLPVSWESAEKLTYPAGEPFHYYLTPQKSTSW